ncbi:MAG: hypothetical protein V6Z82_01025 [Flavobacteriales bacterium]
MNEFEKLSAEMDNIIMDTVGTEVRLPNNITIRGEFFIPTEEGHLQRLQLDAAQPVVTVFDSDARKIVVNDVLIINNTPFKALKKLPDGGGLTVVYLTTKTSAKAKDWL